MSMNLEELLEKIRLESEHELDTHRREYEEKIRKLHESLDAKKEGLKREETETCLRRASAERRRLISCEEVIWHRKILEKKRAAADEAIRRGIELFIKSKEYRKFLEKSLEPAKSGAVFFANKKDAVAKEAILKKNRKARIEPADFRAGVAFSEGGGKEIYTVDALLEKNRAVFEREISGILFEGRV